jgi:Zn-dependent oligopeptidase
MTEDIYLEALQSTYDYIPRLIKGINEYIKLYNSNDNMTEEMIKPLQMIFDGLNWVIDVIDKCKHVFKDYDIEVDGNEINTIMKELIESIENDDDNLVSEILRYEILDVLDKLYKNVEKIVS